MSALQFIIYRTQFNVFPFNSQQSLQFNFWTFGPLEKNSISLTVNPDFSLCPKPAGSKQPLIYFLSVYIRLFLIFHMNKKISGLSDCILSQHNIFIVYPCCSIHHLFVLSNSVLLYGYTTFDLSILQLIDILFISIFFTIIMLLGTSMYKCLCGCMFYVSGIHTQ